MEKSPKNSFEGTGGKMAISLAYVLLGAFATWLVGLNTMYDFGQAAPLVGALAPLFANMIKEFIEERK